MKLLKAIAFAATAALFAACENAETTTTTSSTTTEQQSSRVLADVPSFSPRSVETVSATTVTQPEPLPAATVTATSPDTVASDVEE